MIEKNVKDQNQNKEEEGLTIEVADPMVFGGDFEMELFTPSELGGVVNSYFRNIFKDYRGCKLTTNTNANAYGIDNVSLVLCFSPGSNNGSPYKAFNEVGKDTDKNNGNGPRAAAMQQNNAVRKSNMNFVPTQELIDITYPLLDRMAINFAHIKKSKESYIKSGILTETSVRPDYYSTQMMSMIYMETVSIDKLINLRLTGNDRRYLYRTLPSPIMDYTQNRMHQLYSVEKLDNEALRKKMEQLGLVTKFNDVEIITN